MEPSFLGKGWKFPVKVDQATGRIALAAGEDDIRESIWIILSTARGERVMRPDFGCGIHDLVFDTMSAATLGTFENHVREALVNFEPRIELSGLDIVTDDGRLLVKLTYRVRETNHEFNMVYPFYLSEGLR